MTEDDDTICCPFCGEADGCKHLVAAFDHENATIAGGLLFDREQEITRLVQNGFAALFASRGASVDWRHAPDFEELWEDHVERRQNPEEDPLDAGLLAHLLDSLLRSTDAIEEDDAGVVAFFDAKPLAICDQLSQTIENALHQASRPSQKKGQSDERP